MICNLNHNCYFIFCKEHTRSFKNREFNASVNPFPNDRFLDSSKPIEFADDNFKFDKNGRKFSKRYKTLWGKGEIARNEQFLLFPTVFSKDFSCRHVKTRACLGKD